MTETNYDELTAILEDQRNNILELANSGRMNEQDFDLYMKALNVLQSLWQKQKAISFVHKHTCHACLDGPVQTFPQYDYNLCFDCCAIIIGEHLTDWCKINKEIVA